LYVIERELPPLLPPGDNTEAAQQRRQQEEQRKLWRQQQAGPVVAELKKWLEEQKGKVLPKSVLGQGVGYALNNWAALLRYQEQGYLASLFRTYRPARSPTLSHTRTTTDFSA
jgi:hypothetical protein